MTPPDKKEPLSFTGFLTTELDTHPVFSSFSEDEKILLRRTLQYGWKARDPEIESLKSDNAKLRELLKRLEWQNDEGAMFCPVCTEQKPHGHYYTCPLSAALKGGV